MTFPLALFNCVAIEWIDAILIMNFIDCASDCGIMLGSMPDIFLERLRKTEKSVEICGSWAKISPRETPEQKDQLLSNLPWHFQAPLL